MNPIRYLLCALLMLLQSAVVSAATPGDLLPPEQAFALDVGAEPGHIVATWQIAPDYYMYRDKYAIEAAGNAVRLGKPVIPHGTRKRDEFFGEVETLVGVVRIEIPFKRLDPDVHEITLTVRGQGCNKPVGVCYPPQTHTVTLALASPSAAPQSTAASTAAAPSGGGAELPALFSPASGPRTFLDPDQAFRLTITADGPAALAAHFDIADGYYLYRDKIRFAVDAGPARLGAIALPAGVTKSDAYFGATEVYYRTADMRLPVLGRSGAADAPLTVTAQYQGCAEDGICYNPIEKIVKVGLAGATTTATGTPAAPPPAQAGGTAIWLVLAGAFGAGLLLSFTPCVLPMIPIVAGVVLGGRRGAGKGRAAALAGAYVLGTATAYAAIGAFAGATGDQLQAYFQNPWLIGLLAALVVAMALAMFGLFEIQMPSSVQSWLQTRSARWSGGSLGMVFALGLVSALIVGACVSPVLISTLGIAIQLGDPILGAAIMAVMALGMGLVLIATALGANALVPRAGPWMNRVRQGFGLALLAVAIYLLGNIPAVPVLLLWAVLLIVGAVFFGATQALPPGASGARLLGKGLGTALLVWGVLAMIGGFTGQRDPLRPLPATLLPGMTPAAGPAANTPALFTRVNSIADLDRALAAARSAGRPVMLDYYADWCVDCARMEHGTFADPAVRRVLADHFALLQVDVTNPKDPATRALKQRYGVYGPPAMLFFAADGVERTALRLYGYRSPQDFLRILQRV